MKSTQETKLKLITIISTHIELTPEMMDNMSKKAKGDEEFVKLIRVLSKR